MVGAPASMILGLCGAFAAPVEGPTETRPDMPAPNQSLSIEIEKEIQQLPGEPVKAVEQTAGAPRVPRRKAAVGDIVETERSLPWYRTGLGALAVVLALVGAVYFIVRRWMPAARAVDPGLMRIVARTTLTSKQSLALVSLGRRFVMVGISADRLDCLCEVSEPDEVAHLASRVGMGQLETEGSFDSLLTDEAEEYRGVEPLAEASMDLERPPRTVVPASLTALLGRLRTVQPK